jgi:hypothetical protein
MNQHDQTPSRPAAKRPAGPQGTQLFSAEELRKHASDFMPDTQGRATAHQPVLEGTSEGVEGMRFMLRSGRQTIGRQSINDIVIDDSSVSSSHAWIMNQHGHYVIMNTLSTNGTFVNNKRVHDSVLKHGDAIRFGHAEFVFLTREGGMFSLGHVLRITIGLLVLAGLGALAWWLLQP